MLDMPHGRGDVAGLYGSADIEAMLLALLQTPTQIAKVRPDDPLMQAYYAGYLAACQAIATMTGAHIEPRTRGAGETRRRGER